MSAYYRSRAKLGENINAVACRRFENKHFVEAEARVIVEKELSIFINEEPFATASIAPGLEREFVIGYLFGQGFIDNIAEVKSIKVTGGTARVLVKDAQKIKQRTDKTDYRIVSGGGKSAFFDELELPAIEKGMKIREDKVFQAMNVILKEVDTYQETGGVHASGLFTPEGKPICIIEDIGRHNTLDKVIGYALLNGIDCGNALLISTGRMASEMVVKICRAGIPVVAAKTSVTRLGLEIARRCGLTVITR